MKFNLESFDNISNDKLEKSFNNGEGSSSEAGYRLLLRSPFFENNKNNKVTIKRALEICLQLRKNNKYIEFCDYVEALNSLKAKFYEDKETSDKKEDKSGKEEDKSGKDEDEFAKAKQIFLSLAKSDNLNYHHAIKADAAYQLAKIFLKQEQYKEAAAWLLKAMILNSQLAKTDFVTNEFLKLENYSLKKLSLDDLAILALKQSLIFVAAKLDKKAFGEDKNDTIWKNLGGETPRYQFLKFFINNDKDQEANVIDWMIRNNLYVVVNFLIYCHKEQIINHKLFLDCVDLVLLRIADAQIKSDDTRIKDKLNYQAYIASLELGNFSQADSYLDKISFDFKEAYNNVINQKSDKIKYQVFKKYNDKTNSSQADREVAYTALNSLSNSFNGYDESFKNFIDSKEVTIDKNSFRNNKAKKLLINKAHHAINSENSTEFNSWLKQTHTSSIATIKSAFLTCQQIMQDYWDNRQKIKNKNILTFIKYAPGDFVLNNEKERKEYIDNLNILIKFNFAEGTLQLSEADKSSLSTTLTAISNWATDGKIKFPAGKFSNNMAPAFDEVLGIIQECLKEYEDLTSQNQSGKSELPPNNNATSNLSFNLNS